MIEKLFPRRMFPSAMYSDDYWLGILGGLIIGILSALGGTNAAIGMVIAVGGLRLITWRVDVVTSRNTTTDEAE